MKIEIFRDLVNAGTVINMRLSNAGDGNIQLDFLPVGTNKVGITLPPKSLIGKPAEMDAGIDEFLKKYVASCQAIAIIGANADAELQEAEEQAKQTAKTALANRRPSTTSKVAPAAAGKSVAAAKPARDMNAGLMDDDEVDQSGCCYSPSEEDDEPSGDEQVTSPSVPEAKTSSALDSSLF